MKPDSDLKSDIEIELRWDPHVNETQILVCVENGVVTLKGYVPTFSDKRAAERATKRFHSVKCVMNHIEVNLPGKLRRTDADIALSCARALDAKYSIPRNRVTAVVHDGWVTLQGELYWNFQKEAAAAAVRELMGVSGLTNNITLKKPLVGSNIRNKIVQAIHRRADLEAGQIQVETQNGVVILSGTVRSGAQRDEAQQAAWAAPGVSFVDNRLTVVP